MLLKVNCNGFDELAPIIAEPLTVAPESNRKAVPKPVQDARHEIFKAKSKKLASWHQEIHNT